jgi:hypothetical protein
VLFEREKPDGIPHGFAENYAPVRIPNVKTDNKTYRNLLLPVKITGADEIGLFGEFL